MARCIQLIAALLILVRPFAGCCECHAPVLSAVVATWHEAWGDKHEDDCCQHSAPCQVPDHQGGNCPSCESTKDFVKVASPQLAKASQAWHFPLPVAGDSMAAISPATRSHNSPGRLSCPRLRAHLVLGVMLI
jgi:hypothetical protein